MRTLELPVFLKKKGGGGLAPPPDGGGGPAGPSISIAKTSYGDNVVPAGVNLTAAGFLDYFGFRIPGSYYIVRKATVPGGSTPVGLMAPSQTDYGNVNGIYNLNTSNSCLNQTFSVYSGFPDDSMTDGVDQDGLATSTHRAAHDGAVLELQYSGSGPSTPRGGIMLFPSSSAPKVASFMVYASCTDYPAGLSALQVHCNWAGTGTTVVDQIPYDPGNMVFTRYDITYSNSSGPYLYVYVMVEDLTLGFAEPPNLHYGLCWAGYK